MSVAEFAGCCCVQEKLSFEQVNQLATQELLSNYVESRCPPTVSTKHQNLRRGLEGVVLHKPQIRRGVVL